MKLLFTLAHVEMAKSITLPLESLSGKFQIITFEEFITIALEAPRVVGIYPEIKNPVLINQQVSISH